MKQLTDEERLDKMPRMTGREFWRLVIGGHPCKKYKSEQRDVCFSRRSSKQKMEIMIAFAYGLKLMTSLLIYAPPHLSHALEMFTWHEIFMEFYPSRV